MRDDSLGRLGSILKFIGSTIDCFLTATLYVVVFLDCKPKVLGSTIYWLFLHVPWIVFFLQLHYVVFFLRLQGLYGWLYNVITQPHQINGR